MTYKQVCDRVSKVQIAMPSILVLCQSSGKLNGFENVNDVVHPATAYTYQTIITDQLLEASQSKTRPVAKIQQYMNSAELQCKLVQSTPYIHSNTHISNKYTCTY